MQNQHILIVSKNIESGVLFKQLFPNAKVTFVTNPQFAQYSVESTRQYSMVIFDRLEATKVR